MGEPRLGGAAEYAHPVAMSMSETFPDLAQVVSTPPGRGGRGDQPDFRVGQNDQASAPQPAMNATPPIGVTAPSLRSPVSAMT